MMIGGGGGGGGGGGKSIEEVLLLPILLSERLMKAVEEAESFKTDCSELGKQAEEIAKKLRAVVRLTTSTPSPYLRPIHRVFEEASKSLERALTLVRRCKRTGALRRIFTITISSADFRKTLGLLEASLADLCWLHSIFHGSADTGDIVLSLPPIASNDPIVSWVWSYIAIAQIDGSMSNRIEAANSLSNLALDNDRNKKIIIEEGGVPPLLALLKDGASVDAQIAASTALINLATNHERVSLIAAELAIPIIVQVLYDSPMRLQVCVAALVSRMASHDPVAQEEFARENAIRPLVSLISLGVPLDDPKPAPKKSTSIHSLVQINRNLGMATNSSSLHHDGGSSRGGSSLDHHQHKERENESPAMKLRLRTACAEALWKLSKGCISNSVKITETKGLLCLSKIIEREKGELQFNCLMTVMEITEAAESDAELRRSAFKMNSPAANSVVDQLLRMLQQESSPAIQIPAIRSIGSLSRTFSARETRIIRSLVTQLGHWSSDVVAEAAIALGKFASPENYLHEKHSMAIIESEGVPQLMRLLRPGEKTQLPGLILLCYLALHMPNSEALERGKALRVLESAARTAVVQHSSLRELLPKAIYQLELYHAGEHS